MLLPIHAGEDHRDLGPVPHPAEGPFGRRAPHGGLVPDRGHGGRRRGQSQISSPQRFHDDHAQPRAAAYRGPRCPPGCFGPSSCIESGRSPTNRHRQSAETLRPSRGKRNRRSGCGRPLCLVEEVGHAESLHVIPQHAVERMDEIVIDMVGPQFGQLSGQEAIHGLAGLDHPRGKLGGQLDPGPVAVAEGLAEHDFALACVVGPGRVHVVDALIDGRANLGDGPGFLDLSVLHGQAHAAKAQNRQLIAISRHSSVEHLAMSQAGLTDTARGPLSRPRASGPVAIS